MTKEGNEDMKNKKWKTKLAAAMMCILMGAAVLGGCGSEGKTQKDSTEGQETQGKENGKEKEVSQGTRTVTDAAGNVVEVPEDLSKIAVVPIPWASVIYAIDGSSERLTAIHPTAMSAYTGCFLEKLDPHYGTADTSSIGKDFSINMEEWVNLGIQAAVIWDYETDEARQLKELGIAPIMVKNETVEELQASLKAMGQLLGKDDRAQQFMDAYTDTYEKIKSYSDKVEQADKPKVLYLRNAQLDLQGNDNFIKEALELAGADNVAGDSTQITMEEILEINPDIILLSNFDTFLPSDLYENKIDGQDWSSVNAVVNRRVYKAPMGLYRWDAPGVETPLIMEWLAVLIQPEIFGDIHMETELKEYFKTYFNYELTEEDLGQIMQSEANASSKKP